MRDLLSRLGARLGNWNDRLHGGDSRGEHAPPYGLIDRIAGWLYTLPDR